MTSYSSVEVAVAPAAPNRSSVFNAKRKDHTNLITMPVIWNFQT
jgi:polysaccharide deacetylase 2 family uncharacterized protein YibQ